MIQLCTDFSEIFDSLPIMPWGLSKKINSALLFHIALIIMSIAENWSFMLYTQWLKIQNFQIMDEVISQFHEKT